GVFGIFGHGCVVGVGQALEQGGHSLRYYQGHNEQGMAHAAIAFAKQRNRRAIIPCVSSIGPGALNMVTAAGTATVNRIPLLLLPGDTFACRQPDPVLQQIEQTNDYNLTANDAFKPVCKYWDRINRPEQLMTAMLNAMRVLTDRAETGAVCISLPQDVEAEAYDYPDYFLEKKVWYLDRRPPTQREVEAAAKLIENSKKPLMIIGGGVAYSEAWVTAQYFAERANIPFAETQAGKGLIRWDHPLNLGGIGVTGTAAANEIAKKADLIIAVGSRLSDFTTSSKWLFQNPEVKILTINLNAFDAFKMDATSIIADAKSTLLDLTVALDQLNYVAKWDNEPMLAKESFNLEIERKYTEKLEGGLLQTRALGIINETIDEDAIIVGSSGSLPGCLQRLWKAVLPKTYHLEYGFSCMGYEICGSLGAKMACKDKEVYAMVGDGSFLMLHSELYTALQEGLKINILLFDNYGWGCIEGLQNAQGTDTFGTRFTARNAQTGLLDGDVVPINFAKIAEGYGCKSYEVKDESELKAALEDAKKQNRSTLIDIKVLPKSMSSGYDAWWRVGVAEVSESDSVREAYELMNENIKKSRLY
ncbi:MAG TPA: 3D-(3,5/4)-trihydroxycyclohexane-1,2-dione acylhydrolase (decyclizing), partial [Oscillospiraceae bacterium]|nr:3D-(3,5/4)-trihydroxycyclohexane-1,2-dione acylhydrolase (decyclizing) [Oscillospiraceae bacterium]